MFAIPLSLLYNTVMIKWNRRKYTKEQFIDAWNSSQSIAEVAGKLDCNKSGGGYFTLKQTAVELGLGNGHMTGQGWNKGQNYRPIMPPQPLEKILIENSKFKTSSHLRIRLLKEKILVEECTECGLGNTWNGKPIVLQLDHRNGIKTDNRLENLRLLCPNCHSQTETWGNRKRSLGGMEDALD